MTQTVTINPQAADYRRRLAAEINGMQDVFSKHTAMKDPTTLKIRTCFDQFIQARDTKLKETLLTMSDLLRDALSDVLLDEQAHLGSDNELYDPKALTSWLELNKNHPDRKRSPAHPDKPEAFTVTPHPIAGYFARWVTRYLDPKGEDIGRRELDALHANLKAKNPRFFPPLPTPELLRKIEEMKQGRLGHVHLGSSVPMPSFPNDLAQSLQDEDDALAAAEDARTDKHDTAHDDLQKKRLEQLADIERVGEELKQEHLDRVETLQAATVVLNEKLEEMQGALGQLAMHTEQLEAGNQQLKQFLEETHRLQQRPKKESTKGFWKAAAMILGSAGATYLSNDSNIKVGPMPGGMAVQYTQQF